MKCFDRRAILRLVRGLCGGVLILGLPLVACAATEVNTCGQVFSGSGFLSGNLDCSAFAGDSVTIEGGTFDLRGFTLTGPLSPLNANAVACEKNCKIKSDPPNGMVVAADLCGVLAPSSITVSQSVSIRLDDVTIDGNGCGVLTDNGSITVNESIISNHGGFGVSASRNATIIQSTVSNSGGFGVIAARVKIKESLVSGNNIGVNVGASRASIKDSTISGSTGHGITSGSRISVRDSDIVGNGAIGINVPFNDSVKLVRSSVSGNGEQGLSSPGRVTIRDTTISNNGLEGVLHESDLRMRIKGSEFKDNGTHGIAHDSLPGLCNLRVVDTIATGNGTDPDCGVTMTCADIASCNVPKIAALTCDTSYDIDSGFPGSSFGICALD